MSKEGFVTAPPAYEQSMMPHNTEPRLQNMDQKQHNVETPPQNFHSQPQMFSHQNIGQIAPGYLPQQQTTVIVQPTTFGDFPIQTVCNNCGKSVITVVTRESGTCTWIWCFAICLCCFPLFFIPFVTDCAKDARHSCPSCGSILGVCKP